ncbi:MAG: TerC family protein [Planctomycetaceae bacterium]
MLHYVLTFFVLTLLQAVLGFDNLLYISIESKRVEESQQSTVRRWGIGLAIALRIILLVIVVQVISKLQDPFLHLPWKGVVEGSFNVHAVIVLVGGVFVLYTAVKEIYHMMAADELGQTNEPKRSFGTAMFWIVTMNLVFSFDSILSAIALTSTSEPGQAAVITVGDEVVMSLAIIASGIMMIVLADRVSEFLQKNRLYEVLGLFVLLIVGVLLVSEGGHLAHLKFFGYAVEAMSKTTFYFVIGTLVLVDIVQGRYQRKLMAQTKSKAAAATVATES